MYQGRDKDRPVGMSAPVCPIWNLLENDFYWAQKHIL